MSLARLPPSLLALSPGTLAPPERAGFLGRVRLALGAGLRGVLLRETLLDDREFLDLARELSDLLAEHAGWLGIHDRAHLVLPARAHGLHLGFRSLLPKEVRPLVGDAVAIGLSTHVGDLPSAWAGVDYRFFGPVFPTPSKEGLLSAVGPEGLRRSVVADRTPVWALGGIRSGNLKALAASGASGAALLAGILGAPDVAAATRDALDSWPGDSSEQA